MATKKLCRFFTIHYFNVSQKPSVFIEFCWHSCSNTPANSTVNIMLMPSLLWDEPAWGSRHLIYVDNSDIWPCSRPESVLYFLVSKPAFWLMPWWNYKQSEGVRVRSTARLLFKRLAESRCGAARFKGWEIRGEDERCRVRQRIKKGSANIHRL